MLCCVGLKIDCDPVLEQVVTLAVATGAEVDILHAVKYLSDDVVNTLRVNIPDCHILDTLRDQRLKEAKEAKEVLDSRIETFWAGHHELRESYGYRELPCSVLEGYPTQASPITKGVIKRSHVPVVVVQPRRD
ncbi:hypothetical protein [Halomonas aquatica]|uniref:Universal stress protein family protein n=1 Tax=Halomonas aquatica TaxID=3151123 RepID=A0ABV1NC61_9GAMM